MLEPTSITNNLKKWLFIVVLIDSISFGIILPIIPILSITLNLNSFHIGLLLSIFAFFQFFTTPFLGFLSDKFGRKKIIIYSLLGVSFSYLLTGLSSSFIFILIARALCGIFTSNFAVVLASGIDISGYKERSKILGFLGASYGIGFIIGPFIGGLLSSPHITHTINNLFLHLPSHQLNIFTTKIPFYFASIISFIAFLFSLFKIKETNQNLTSSINIKNILNNIFKTKQIYGYMSLSIFLFTGYSAIQVFLIIYLAKFFHLNNFMIGLIGTYFALIVSLTQLFLPKYLKENISILIGILLAIIGSLILDFNANSLSFIIISLSCYGIALGLIYPNINSKISKISNTNNLGITLSINQMSAILGQSIGPIFLGYIYYLSPSYLWLSLSINFTICLLIFILFKKYIKS